MEPQNMSSQMSREIIATTVTTATQQETTVAVVNTRN
jgi:hypothetical protein